jgi:hypothetical protein
MCLPVQTGSGTVARCSIRLEATDSDPLSERPAGYHARGDAAALGGQSVQTLFRKHKLPAARSLPRQCSSSQVTVRGHSTSKAMKWDRRRMLGGFVHRMIKDDESKDG